MKVRVSFDYYPDDPDPDDSTGMSEAEHEALMNKVMSLGGDDMQVEKVEES
jgi:hypothetical protein